VDVTSADQARRIAAACRVYLAAWENRKPGYPYMTLHEHAATAVLRHELAAHLREETSPTTGTAA
jgi:DNA polymerase III alpha subunit